jgi:hypothetical protein
MQKLAMWGMMLALSVGVWSCSNGDQPFNSTEEEEEEEKLELLPPEDLPSPVPEAWVYGRLMDARTGGALVPSSLVRVSAGEHTASMEGGLFFIKLPADQEHLLVVEAPEGEYPRTSHRVKAQAGVSTFVELWMLSFEAAKEFDAEAGGEIETPDGAKVVFPAGSLNATGEVTARLAWLNAANKYHLAAFPVGFRTDADKLLESFGAIAIEVRDGDGKLVNLKEGAEAQATIPASSNVPEGEVPLWTYDEEAGVWKEEGELSDCSTGFCTTNLPHLSWWGQQGLWWGSWYDTTCLNVYVTDTNGNPVAGVALWSMGNEYHNYDAAFSDVNGYACLLALTNSTVRVTAFTLDGQDASGIVQVSTGSTQHNCGSTGCIHVPLTVNLPKFQAFLADDNMSASPRLEGPTLAVEHLLTAPWSTALFHSHLSLSTCAEGTYLYAIVYPGQWYDVRSKVTLLLPNGDIQSYSMEDPYSEEYIPVWHVGELHCNSNPSCQCTWTPLNTLEKLYPRPLI